MIIHDHSDFHSAFKDIVELYTAVSDYALGNLRRQYSHATYSGSGSLADHITHLRRLYHQLRMYDSLAHREDTHCIHLLHSIRGEPASIGYTLHAAVSNLLFSNRKSLAETTKDLYAAAAADASLSGRNSSTSTSNALYTSHRPAKSQRTLVRCPRCHKMGSHGAKPETCRGSAFLPSKKNHNDRPANKRQRSEPKDSRTFHPKRSKTASTASVNFAQHEKDTSPNSADEERDWNVWPRANLLTIDTNTLTPAKSHAPHQQDHGQFHGPLSTATNHQHPDCPSSDSNSTSKTAHMTTDIISLHANIDDDSQHGSHDVVDSGATHDIVRDRALLQDYHPSTSNRFVMTAGGHRARILGSGTRVLNTLLPSGRTRTLRRQNVLHVKGASLNLISVSSLAADGFTTTFGHDLAHIRNATGQVQALAHNVNGLYRL